MFGLGLKAGLLFGCMSSAGPQLNIPLNKYFSYEANYLISYANYQNSLKNSDELRLADIDTSEVTITNASVRRQMLHNQFRYFPAGGSFNLALGVGASQMQSQFAAARTDEPSQTIEQNIDYRNAFTTFTVGNMWRWKHGYVGIDWLGFNSVFAVKKIRSNDDLPNQSSDPLTATALQFEKRTDVCGLGGGSNLLVLNFGVNF